MSAPLSEPGFAPLLQDFFCARLQTQRGASPHTVASYRGTFKLLLHFAQQRLRRSADKLALADLDAPLVLAFLEHLERERGNRVPTRNARLAALRAFAHYAALRAPSALAPLQRVLAIPFKRFDRPEVGSLTRAEVAALLAAPDASTWSGQRDCVLLHVLYNTGARVAELVGLNLGDISLAGTPSAHLRGKGRKERTVPLWRDTRRQLQGWMRRLPADPETPLFPNRRAERLTRSGVQTRLNAACQQAARTCPSLHPRRVTPHLLRHTTAMHLLQAGIDITVIALWLGHESPATTHRYLDADLALKERALAKLPGPPRRRVRYQPSDRVLAFLDGL
jgi:integrase/recombinase XerD